MANNNGRKVDKNGRVTYPGYSASNDVRKAAASALGGFADKKKPATKKGKK